ncbi:MAG: serine/threonine protein kinase, partial [Xanthomonadales bacterium]|nr:serine/threonine protein kinase [Xanthomonadales bacterium]
MSQTQPDTVPVPASQLTLTGHPLDQAPADVDQLHPGTMVGPYRLLRPLGRGGMGEVWLAEQTAPLKREVAIKMLARRINDRMAEAWFLVERQALAMLVHPYIAQIYDAGQLPGGGAMFFAMEYIEGTTLDRWVSQRKPALTEVAELLERICTGMQHAHQRGLIHRDLKPANLLVRDDGQVPLPKIIDFGVAVGGVPGQQVQIDQKVTIGTAAYMAPEQSRPTAEGIDARVDVYALGATLANILCSRAGLEIEVRHALSHVAASLTRTGINPADHAPTKPALHALRKSIPKELRAIAVKAMAADREQRYESAAALGAD